jgi:plasmid stability protein
MAELKVRNLDDAVAGALNARPQANGASLEEEVRRTLAASVAAGREELVRRAKAVHAAAGDRTGRPEGSSARRPTRRPPRNRGGLGDRKPSAERDRARQVRTVLLPSA